MYAPSIQLKRRSHTEWGASAPLPDSSDTAPSQEPSVSQQAVANHAEGDIEEPRRKIWSAFGRPYLDAEDERWIRLHTARPERLTDVEKVGLAVAMHYRDGGPLIGYRHPIAYMDAEKLPHRYSESNRALRAGLASAKYPDHLVCTVTDLQGRDYWGATGRCMAFLDALTKRGGYGDCP